MIVEINAISDRIKNNCSIDHINNSPPESCMHSTGVYADIQKLLKMARDDNIICDIHRKYSKNINKKCDVCF